MLHGVWPAGLVVLAFLMGSIPFGVIVSRMMTGHDVRESGSGNIGAANVARVAGKKGAVMVALGDALKGTVPVLLGLRLQVGHGALALIALAAVLGHDFSLFLRFKGGKGVATTLGVTLALAPITGLIGLVSWALILVVSGYSSLASLLALALLPVFMVLTGQPVVYVAAAFGLFLLGLGKHWENVLRLAQGKEQNFKQRRPADGI